MQPAPLFVQLPGVSSLLLVLALARLMQINQEMWTTTQQHKFNKVLLYLRARLQLHRRLPNH